MKKFVLSSLGPGPRNMAYSNFFKKIIQIEISQNFLQTGIHACVIASRNNKIKSFLAEYKMSINKDSSRWNGHINYYKCNSVYTYI